MRLNVIIAGITCVGIFFTGWGFTNTLAENTWIAWVATALGIALNLWLNINATRNAYQWGKLDAYNESLEERLEHLRPKRD